MERRKHLPDTIAKRSGSFAHRVLFIGTLLLLQNTALPAAHLDTIGVTLLRQFDPTLLGNGIPVAEVEARADTNHPPVFEVNPASIGQSASLFTYQSQLGTSTTFPNSVGAQSGHANNVAAAFFGTAAGVAPGVSHVYNYEADYFYDTFIDRTNPQAIPVRIVNQSFVFDQSSTVEMRYDNHAARFGTLFISGAAQNFKRVQPAASSFNGIGVGVSDDGNPPFGPTLDGRCKPDLVAPGSVASFATPHVAGSAALLLQAAARGDAGPGTSIATNHLVIKALLLNGAIKPNDWTNSPTSPLDHRRGAGVVNVFNSWMQLKGGRHSQVETTSVTKGNPHPPGSKTNNVPAIIGWNIKEIANTQNSDKIDHYYFELPGTNDFTFTATLAWNRQQNKTAINDLNLFLYEIATGNQIAASISTVDNVEHLAIPRLGPGRYDLQVLKRGTANQVSATETYALAFESFQAALEVALTNGQIAITWPVAPTGFKLYSTADLQPANWLPVSTNVEVDTNAARHVVLLPANESRRYFRLQRP